METLIKHIPAQKVYGNNEQLKRILHGCRLNERAAQKELYCSYYGYAMSIALRYSSSYDNAVEMTNDAFFKIYKDLKNFTPQNDNTTTSFKAWLKKVVVNASIDHIRKYHKKEMMATAEIETISIADYRETGEDILQYKEIIKCIQQLSPAYRTVFNLYVLEGFSHPEIAERLKISEGSSKSNLFKARQNLQQLLKKNNAVNYEETLSAVAI